MHSHVVTNLEMSELEMSPPVRPAGRLLFSILSLAPIPGSFKDGEFRKGEER